AAATLLPYTTLFRSTSAPGTDRLFVGEQAGKLYSFPKDQSCARPDLFLDLTTELHGWDKAKVRGVGALYGLTFHPQFARNRYCRSEEHTSELQSPDH